MKSSPLHIELLIHYHCIKSPYPGSLRSHAVKEYTKQLLRNGLIVTDENPSGYITTKKGADALSFLLTALDVLAIHKSSQEVPQ